MQPAPTPLWHLYLPKLVTVLRQGYGPSDFRQDALAGLTVAIVALPLAMALAIASGASPDKGLITAITAGFIISALGGSRFQIGGPTGAFVVVVFNVIAEHGYDGLVLATLIAGLVLIAAGVLRLGTWIKYVPQPVILGFTSGIALIIFTAQLRDLFGLSPDFVPGDVLPKLQAFWAARETWVPAAAVLSVLSLATIIALRRWAPRLPGFLLVVVGASVAVWALDLPVETIGSRFGGIPDFLPAPALPVFSAAKIVEVMPAALTIAFLAGIEALLSAVVADGMTGRHHRSNCELVAQGVANFVAACFAGLPATGAIARTATNIKAGARSPVAGLMHALILLVFMLALAPLASAVPLAALAAVLVMVAWNMSEAPRLLHYLRAPLGDRVVLLVTLLLTVFWDLTVAIEVGVVMGALLFMHRMADAVALKSEHEALLDDDRDDWTEQAPRFDQRQDLPEGVEVFQLRGPLFFGVANRLSEVLETLGRPVSIFILRFREVPLIDVTGAHALEGFVTQAAKHGTQVILSGVRADQRRQLGRFGLSDGRAGLHFVENYAAALALSEDLRKEAEPAERERP